MKKNYQAPESKNVMLQTNITMVDFLVGSVVDGTYEPLATE